MDNITWSEYRDLCLGSGHYCIGASLGMALLRFTSFEVGLVQGAFFSFSAVSWGLITNKAFQTVCPDLAKRVEDRDPNLSVAVNIAVATNFYALAILTTTYVVSQGFSFFRGKKVSYGELVKLSIVDSAAFFCWVHVDYTALRGSGEFLLAKLLIHFTKKKDEKD